MIQELKSYAFTFCNMYTWSRTLAPRLNVQFGRKCAYKKCNKGAGSRKRIFIEPEAAVVYKLSWGKQEEVKGVAVPESSTRLIHSTPVLLDTK